MKYPARGFIILLGDQPHRNQRHFAHQPPAKQCMQLICPACVNKLVCDPWEKKMARIEACNRFLRSTALLTLFIFLGLAPFAHSLTNSGPLVITSANNGQIFQNLKITSTSGPCVTITGATNVTIQNVEVGPCGTNNTTSDSTGIEITNSSTINVYDSYIHVENLASSCSDTHDGIYITNASSVLIQGNVIGYNESNIRMQTNNSNITVKGNYVFNPRGAASCANADNLFGRQVQAWAYPDTSPNSNITYDSNYVYNSTDTSKFKFAGRSADFLSFGVTNGGTATNNWVGGTNQGIYSGATGIIGDYKANSMTFTNNIVSDTYQSGIDVAGGTNHLISGNKVLIGSNGTTGDANSNGIGVTGSFNSPLSCNTITVSNNVAYAKQSGGYVGGYYDDGYCSGVSLSGNTFGSAAYAVLNPLTTTNPPPLIPPVPKNCVVTSPYTTQTGTPCNGALPAVPTGLTATII
jgi:hypothetical protein